ncbi:hypothetical protein L7F22_067089 [Adiantum nelumboides]|nr:hypothetical protein [Adiantum nelumboides]
MEGIPPGERLHLQRILELDAEQLEVEEVDSDDSPSYDDDERNSLDGHGDGGGGRTGGFTFDISLASTHSYLGEVDDIHCRRSFWDGGATLTLPMFYLEGIVLFPEATLPLRVIQPRFKAAVELAMKQEEATCTIGVDLYVQDFAHICKKASLKKSSDSPRLGRVPTIQQLVEWGPTYPNKQIPDVMVNDNSSNLKTPVLALRGATDKTKADSCSMTSVATIESLDTTCSTDKPLQMDVPSNTTLSQSTTSLQEDFTVPDKPMEYLTVFQPMVITQQKNQVSLPIISLEADTDSIFSWTKLEVTNDFDKGNNQVADVILILLTKGQQTHEVGESSRPPQTEDEICRTQLVTAVAMFTQVMQNPRFMAFLQPLPPSQSIENKKAEPAKAQPQIHVRANPHGDGLHFSVVGTTAEIRQLRHLEDGSINVVTRGRQRFRTSHAWINVDGVPCAQVQIIPEDMPLHIPRDAFGALASIENQESGKVPKAPKKLFGMRDGNRKSDADELECEDDCPSVFSNLPEACISNGSHSQSASVDEGSASEDDETSPRWWWGLRRDVRNQPRQAERVDNLDAARFLSGGSDCSANETPFQKQKHRRRSVEADWGGACKAWALDESKWLLRPQQTAWPHWVYRMFDAYSLARRAADMWRQMVELPSLNDLVQKPELLSYYIASKIPVQDATRQELLEIDGVVSRLRKEIQLLESMDRIRCKTCKNVVARRSDMLVMSSDGPLGVYVNNAGYVHETLTLAKARGLILQGRPETMHSWFPGYSWTVADCNLCESHMGWLFKALKKDLHPRQFWGLRRSQLAEKASV